MIYHPTDEEIDRFWSKVNRSGGECWEWQAGTGSHGYGRFKSGCGTKLAHRFAYFMQHGEIPDGMQVCHKCDNPPCVRPDHLELGDMYKNMGDAVFRHRTAVGVRNGRAKLTPDDVLEIVRLRREGVMIKELEKKFGVTYGAIGCIMNGANWSHVTGIPYRTWRKNNRQKLMAKKS